MNDWLSWEADPQAQSPALLSSTDKKAKIQGHTTPSLCLLIQMASTNTGEDGGPAAEALLQHGTHKTCHLSWVFKCRGSGLLETYPLFIPIPTKISELSPLFLCSCCWRSFKIPFLLLTQWWLTETAWKGELKLSKVIIVLSLHSLHAVTGNNKHSPWVSTIPASDLTSRPLRLMFWETMGSSGAASCGGLQS